MLISFSKIKRITVKALNICMTVVCGCMFYSCGAVYDEEIPCEGRYLVEFRFTNNIMETDAFASKVPSVTLLIYDKDGNYVSHQTESGVALQQEHYSMVIDIEPGTYDLLAWCGLEGSNAFSLTGGDVPQTMSEAKCIMEREYDEAGAMSRQQLDPLFHAFNTNVVFPEGESADHRLVTVMDVMKDTNTIRLVLTHYNGQEIDPDDFSFKITDDNGFMDFDNSLMEDEVIVYKEWIKKDLPTVSDEIEAAMGTRAVTVVNSMLAEIDMARLMIDHNPRLEIQRKDKDEPVLSLPITQLLLHAKGEAKSYMSDQRYLDCQDEYNLLFFLTDDDGWYMPAGIYVNGWHVMYQNSGI